VNQPMTSREFVQLALNLHTRTIVTAIDAAMRAETPAQRDKYLVLARDASLEFKTDMLKILSKETV
jgi:hypothetical protein